VPDDCQVKCIPFLEINPLCEFQFLKPAKIPIKTNWICLTFLNRQKNIRFVHWHNARCAYTLMYVQFVHSALGNESTEVQIVYKGTCSLAWEVIFDRRRDWGVVCVFSIFDAGGSVCGCRYVYSHRHTHTAHMVYLDVSPGVGMRHLEGPKNPDGLHLGIYVLV